MTIRPGGPGDAKAVLDLFDEAVAWLVARGQTGRWGTEPFSAFERRIERVREWAGGEGLRIAEISGVPVGALVLGSRPPWVEPAASPELYVEALVTSRSHAGQDIGAALIRRAVEETRAAGLTLLRVDCWAGAPPLVAWYERQGFRRSGRFDVRGWIGQVFTMRLAR